MAAAALEHVEPASLPPEEPCIASAPPPGAPAPGRRRFLLRLRVIVPLAAALLLAGAVLGSSMISERNARSLLVRELEAHLVLEARNLALTSQGALLDGYPELTLQPLIREMLAERPALAFAVVIDHKGRIRGKQDAHDLGQPYRRPARLELMTPTTPLKANERLLSNPSLLIAEAPVLHSRGKRIGTAIVGMRRGYLESAIRELRRRQMVLLTLVLTLGGLATLFMISMLLRPISQLRQGFERIGRGDLEHPLEIQDRTELGLLAESVNQMAARLKIAQHEALERQRLASEMEFARRIQSEILPAHPMRCGDFILAGRHRAAAEVGGDYYDLLPLPDGRVGMAIADVCGKGVGGCLVMSMISAVLRTLRTAYGSPAEMLVALDRSLSGSLRRGSFVTMIYGILDPVTGQLVFASAGHLPVLLFCAQTGALEWRRSRAIPIGAVRGGALAARVQDEEISLAPGDMMVQFTDGYSEAMEPKNGEQFGFERIEAVVKQHARRGAEAVVAALSDRVSEWTGAAAPMDDETLLVVSRNDAEAERPAGAPDALADSETTPVLLLERAERGGRRLSIGSVFELAPQLPSWLEACPDLGSLESHVLRLAETALYETCTNILEHGYRGLGPPSVDLWWIPDPAWLTTAERQSAARDRPALYRRIGAGRFVVRDRGRAFDPSRPVRADFTDAGVRRRGRGFGLQMIHRIMAEVAYRGNTTEGNITVMKFDPERIDGSPREVKHG